MILGTFLTLLLIAASSCTNVATADLCQSELIETMPLDMDYLNPIKDFKLKSTYQALMDIIDATNTSLKIASFYWCLSADEELAKDASTHLGRNLMNAIEASANRGVKVEVVIDGKDASMSQKSDIDRLKSFADFKTINVSSILGSGVMHSKFIIGDLKHFYLGSSNFDWRSYTHVKEIGIKFDDCEVLAKDLNKIFKTYQLVADSNAVPNVFPDGVKTSINIQTPLELAVSNFKASVFLGAAPPAFNNNSKTSSFTGRTDDIEGLLKTIDSANEFIYISVMNYSPETQYLPERDLLPWIDNALRAAVSKRNVKVKLLFSDWFNKDQLAWYRSLNAVNFPSRKSGIRVKKFKVPKLSEFERKLRFARVKHDKYMVTEKTVYVGTSNWTPDYFIDTCGVGFVANFHNSSKNESNLIYQAKAIFERDFESIFATDFY